MRRNERTIEVDDCVQLPKVARCTNDKSKAFVCFLDNLIAVNIELQCSINVNPQVLHKPNTLERDAVGGFVLVFDSVCLVRN